MLERLQALAARENQDVTTLAKAALETVLEKQASDDVRETVHPEHGFTARDHHDSD